MNSSTILILEYLVIVLVLMVIPFFPIFMSIRDKKDMKPLPINLEYSKNPRAIAKYFDKYFLDSFDEESLEKGMMVKSEKLGKLEVLGNNFSKMTYENMVYIVDESTVPQGVTFEKEVIARKKLTLSDHCKVRVIKAEEKLVLGKECCVTRWIDVEGSMQIGESSHINIASCSSAMYLAKGVTFNRLYAYPILTSHYFTFKHDMEKHKEALIGNSAIEDNLLYIKEKKYVIKKDEQLLQSIVTKGELTVEDNVKIFGSIKSNGSVTIGANCFVNGNIIAEEDIIIGENSFISGNLFSRQTIDIGRYSQIGTSENTKSIVSKGKITLGEHVAVFNYILTDEIGEIV